MRSSRVSTTRSSTRSAPRPTGAWASRARISPGSWPATAFVAWYNGHPDFQDVSFDLSCERVVVVGNGNVAVDVARMLALTADELAPTDTTDEAIAAIVGSGVREILVLGRRGPAQAAFTNPELVELTELAGADLIVDPADLELDPASEAALEDDAMAQRNLAVLREVAAAEPGGQAARDPAALPHVAGGDPRRGSGRGRRGREERARRRRSRRPARRSHRRAGGDPVRRRPAQRRLSRRAASRGCRSTTSAA